MTLINLITDVLNEDIDPHNDDIFLVILASDEYFKSINILIKLNQKIMNGIIQGF